MGIYTVYYYSIKKPAKTLEERLAYLAELEHLGEQITELAAHLDAGHYQFLVLLEAFDREQGWGGTGILSCAHWHDLRGVPGRTADSALLPELISGANLRRMPGATLRPIRAESAPDFASRAIPLEP